jgi:hypothetical protein
MALSGSLFFPLPGSFAPYEVGAWTLEILGLLPLEVVRIVPILERGKS